MIRCLACIVLVAVLVSEAGADAELTPEEVCKLTTCRKAGIAQVLLDQHRYLEIPLAGTVIAHEANISIFPGEDHLIEAELIDGQIANLRPLIGETNTQTIEVSFSQEVDDEGTVQSLLKVTNPFEFPLRYEAHIATEASEGFQYTSSCPVQPGLVAYEHWPYSVIHIVMTEVRLLHEDDVEAGVVTCH